MHRIKKLNKKLKYKSATPMQLNSISKAGNKKLEMYKLLNLVICV